MKKSNQLPLPPPLPKVGFQSSFEKKSDLNQAIREYVREIKGFLRKHNIPMKMDTTDAMIQRRSQAVAAYTERIIERYLGKPGYEQLQRNEIGDTWIRLNFTSVVTYNLLERQSHMLFAASIWILDRITELPDWRDKLYRILPRDDNLLDEIDAPDVWDCCHDYYLILSVLYVLYNRNTGTAPMEKDSETTNRVITSSLIADGGQHTDTPSRRAYDALINLIPQQAIEQAAAHFEELLWKWTDRYFSCLNDLILPVHEAIHTANTYVRQFNDTREKLKEAADAAERQKVSVSKQPAVNPLLRNPVSLTPADLDTFMNSGNFPLRSDTGPLQSARQNLPMKEHMHQVLVLGKTLTELTDRYEEARNRLDEAEDRRASFATNILKRGYIRPSECREDYGKDVAAHMIPLSVPDPYEICFALLWLTENGSDLPWLYGPGAGMIQEASESLPWAIIEYDELDDPVWEVDHQEPEQLSITGLPNPPKQVKSSAVQDWYERRYEPHEEDTFVFDRSLAQIVYEETGCIMPRDLHMYDIRQKALKEYGLTGKEITPLLYIMTALSNARRQTPANNFEEAYMSLVDSPDKPEKAASVHLTYDEMAEQLIQLRETNKQLRASLHDAERTVRDTGKELASVRNAAKLEHRELADLRELVFQQENAVADTAQTEEPIDESSFPYEVVKDTVVFGGHETWLKAIRPMLTGNIRFVDKDMVFDSDIIRHADILWIQTNALSHKQYYRIIAAARQYQKPVRYFTYASAVKCAVQLMEEDRL